MKNMTKTALLTIALMGMSTAASAQGLGVNTGVGVNTNVGVETGVVDTDVNSSTNANTKTYKSNKDEMDNYRAQSESRTEAQTDTNVRYEGNNIQSEQRSNINAQARSQTDLQLSSSQVRTLQSELSQSGYNVSVDGKIGAETRSAIRSFQKDNNLKATGRLDQQTSTKLGMGAY